MAKNLTARPDQEATVARRKPVSKKPNGQWKIDGKTPLNANEEFKLADDGLHVRQRIIETYSQQGFDSIDSDDLHGRFRWWGLYTQRKEGIDGGRTATLSPEELEDKYFMLRVRIDSGQLTSEQTRVIGEISRDYGRDTADITDRQNVQLHWIEVESVPDIWRRLEAVNLDTTEACGDVSRVILGSPLAGIAADEIIDPTPVIHSIKEKYIGDPAFSNLPRKFKTCFTGHPSQDVVHEINDIAFVGVEHPELGPGYDLWVGGGLSTNPKLAERLGVFVTQEQAEEVWVAVISIFRDYGYRRLRNKARLKFLVADWGVEKFRQVLQDEYLGYELPDGPAPQTPSVTGDHVGVHRQKDGRYYVGLTPTVGRISGTQLINLATAMERFGSRRLRTTPYQKLVVLDLAQEDVEPFIEEAEKLGFYARPSVFRRSTIACTGIEYCKLAIVATKSTAARVIDALEERMADVTDQLPQRLTLHINGCPNSCARIQTADIGLKGQIITTDDGRQVPGFQVHLGGGLADYQNRATGVLGRTVRGLKVEADVLEDYLERLIRTYVRERVDSQQTFAQWAVAADEKLLL